MSNWPSCTGNDSFDSAVGIDGTVTSSGLPSSMTMSLLDLFLLNPLTMTGVDGNNVVSPYKKNYKFNYFFC